MYRADRTRRPRIGDVYLMEFTGSGCEQRGLRPGLVFQNNLGNTHSPNIIALPLTTALKKRSQPTHVLLAARETGLLEDSMVLCENPERVSKERIRSYITTLGDQDMARVAAANLLASSAIAYLDSATLLSLRQQAIQLNSKRD